MEYSIVGKGCTVFLGLNFSALFINWMILCSYLVFLGFSYLIYEMGIIIFYYVNLKSCYKRYVVSNF